MKLWYWWGKREKKETKVLTAEDRTKRNMIRAYYMVLWVFILLVVLFMVLCNLDTELRHLHAQIDSLHNTIMQIDSTTQQH